LIVSIATILFSGYYAVSCELDKLTREKLIKQLMEEIKKLKENNTNDAKASIVVALELLEKNEKEYEKFLKLYSDVLTNFDQYERKPQKWKD
jgi:hypothetical protein